MDTSTLTYEDIAHIDFQNDYNENPYVVFARETFNCPTCNGIGTLRVESFTNDRYNDYDTECEDCCGTGKIKGEVLLDKLA